VILGVDARHLSTVLDRAAAAEVGATVIGTTGGGALAITVDGQAALTMAVGELHAVWSNALEDALTKVGPAVPAGRQRSADKRDVGLGQPDAT
jgi:hypothetical protein